MTTVFKSFRTAFFAGLILLAPLAVTIYVVNLLVSNVGGGFRSYFFFFVPDAILERRDLSLVFNFAATILVLAFITGLGFFSRYFFGRFLVNTAERLITTVPFVNTVYNSVKQIVQTFSSQQRAVFQKVVMIEYPRKGVYALGFLTSMAKGEAQARTSNELCNVFLPTTPNPTSGFLLMIPKEEVIEMDMTVGDGMKLIISGGAVVPAFDPESAPPKEIGDTRIMQLPRSR